MVMNFRLFAKTLSVNDQCLVLFNKDRAKALIRKNIIREMLYLTRSRKFSPAKSSLCTITYVYAVRV